MVAPPGDEFWNVINDNLPILWLGSSVLFVASLTCLCCRTGFCCC